MAESAALLVDEVLPHEPMRQWVLSVPFPLRFLFASEPKIMGKVLGIVYRTIATHLTRKAGYTKMTAHTGAVTLASMWTVQGHPQDSAGLKPRPTANSINSATPLPVAWLGIWNARVC